MMVRGRTLAIIIIITMLLSSFLTFMVLQRYDLSVLIEQNSINNKIDNGIVKETEQVPQDLKKLTEVYEKILNVYVIQQAESDLIDGAIRGMIQTLKDPHSIYMDQKEAEDFFKSLSDSFEGIGAEVTMENGRVTIIAPIKGSPSEKAGIKPRDQILKVNGESLEGLNLFEAVNKIRGPKGTKAVLEVMRSGLNDPITITVIRDEIPIKTVHSETITSKKGTIGKIEITNFGEKTSKEFKVALSTLEKEKIKGLIIDVRGNPGGYLQSVLEIGNLVVPNQGTIVQIEDKTKKIQTYKSKLDEAKYPIVILTDGGSASASEILASALQEAGKYPVVGEASFGKGTVQNPFELSDGSNIKLTVAKWLTPNGNWIHEKGVQPDVKVSQPDYFQVMPFPENVQLKRDMNNTHVKNLQLILSGLGYKPNRFDGYFDQSTELAVKTFQKANGLNATGIVESETANKLQEKIIARIRDSKSDLQLQVGIETLFKKIK